MFQDPAREFTLLTGLKFAVFGLGNRQYEHYNAMGRLTNTRLAELGGTPVYKYGEGDDDGTLEEDFDGWKDDLWAGLRADLGLGAWLSRLQSIAHRSSCVVVGRFVANTGSVDLGGHGFTYFI